MTRKLTRNQEKEIREFQQFINSEKGKKILREKLDLAAQTNKKLIKDSTPTIEDLRMQITI